MIDVRVVEPLPADADWRSLGDGSSYYSMPPWLACAGRTTGGVVGAVEVRRDGQLLAAAPYWLTTGRENELRTPAEVLADVGVGGQRFLVAGTSTAYLSELPAVDARTRREVLPLVVAELHRLAEHHRVDGVLALYADTALAADYAHVLPGRTPVLLNTEASLPVPADFGAYPLGVSGQRRRRVHREWRRFDASGYDLAVEPLDRCVEEFVPLYLQLERRHGAELDPDDLIRVLAEQARSCGEAALVFTARRAGRLVAACLCFGDGVRLVARMFAADFAVVGGAYEYFGVTYYLPVRYAIAHGYRHLHLGVGTVGAKIARGALLEPLWAVDLGLEQQWEAATAREANDRHLVTLSASDVPPTAWATPPPWADWVSPPV